MNIEDQTMCRVKSIMYDFETFTGHLFMHRDSVSDMQGTINVFQSLDPNVLRIYTWQNGKPDTQYRFIDGEWMAF